MIPREMNPPATSSTAPDKTCYDFVVLGGGSAGYAAARTASETGLRTAVIESGPDIGGLCILRGCMPSKTLIESATRLQAIRHAKDFGLSVDGVEVDVPAIIERKRRLIGDFADYRSGQLQSGRFDFIRGRASFESDHLLTITNGEDVRQIEAASVLIATGSVVAVPDIPGLAETGFLTSDDILEMESLPRSMIVLGAGAVGLELAYYLNALGVEITVVQRSSQILKGVDPDAAEALRQSLIRQGMKIFTDTQLQCIEGGDSKRATFLHDGQPVTIEAEALFNALGRRPNLDPLCLEKAGVVTEHGRLCMQPTQQTSVPTIFAAGDACGPLEIVHIAVAQGEIAARNAARVLGASGETLEQTDYRLKMFAVFTEPEVAICGITEEEARQAGLEVLSASYPFDDHGKSMLMGKTAGFVKLIVDKATREILGGACVGPHASDLIQEVAVAMAFHGTAGDLARVPHYHPTLSEIWTYPAEELME